VLKTVAVVSRAESSEDLDEIRRLFREYHSWLSIDLSFQSFDDELRGLPGRYALRKGLAPPRVGAGRWWVGLRSRR